MTKSNYKRGTQYFYIHKASLACAFLGGGVLCGPTLNLYLKRPDRPKFEGDEFHRVEINVIHTKAEAKALNRKWAKIRAQRRAEAKAA